MTDAEKIDALLAVCVEFDRLALVISSSVRNDEGGAIHAHHRAVMDALMRNIAVLNECGAVGAYIRESAEKLAAPPTGPALNTRMPS